MMGCAKHGGCSVLSPASSLTASTQLHTPPRLVPLLRKQGEDHVQGTGDLHIMMVEKHKPCHEPNLPM